MENLKEILENRLKELEQNIIKYNEFTLNKSNPEDDRKIVAFKLFFEMVSFNEVIRYFPDYEPDKATIFLMANAFRGMNSYVNIADGRIEISEEYYKLLTKKEELTKKQKAN